MTKRLVLFVCLAAAVWGGVGDNSVRGEIKGAGGNATFLAIELVDIRSQRAIDRVFAASDGTFEIRGVESGYYVLRVVTQMGEVLATADADVRQTGSVTPVVIALPEASGERPTGERVSVAQLRHKPSKAAWKVALEAQKRSERGEFAAAEEMLQKAIQIDPEWAALHTNRGAQLVRLRRPVEAEAEFRRAIALDPADAQQHSNLAVALLMLGRVGEAEVAARQALKLDANNERARHVFDQVMTQVRTASPARSPRTGAVHKGIRPGE